MKLPPSYTPLAAYVAPARERSEPWRLGAGMALILMLALTMATAFGALLGALLPPTTYTAYIEATSAGPGEILFRRCRGRSDYVGERNHWARMTELVDHSRLAARIAREIGLACVPESQPRLVA